MVDKQIQSSYEKSKIKEKEALHLLFQLADSDHSDHIDPSELMGILRQLGWKLDVKVARRLCEIIGAVTDEPAAKNGREAETGEAKT